jgi:protein-tyrosine phosphatase
MNTFADIIQCSADEAKQLVSSRRDDIGGVINVAYNLNNYGLWPLPYDPWMPVLHQPHLDEVTPPPEWFDVILAFYDHVRRTNKKTLVHCYAGLNRSRGTFGVLLVARHQMSAAKALEITGQPGHWAWRVAVENFAKARKQ